MLIAGRNFLVPWLVVAGLSIPATVAAQEFCSEPVAPYCVAEGAQLDTSLQITRCEKDLEDYATQLDEYEQCVANQIQSLREELENARRSLEESKQGSGGEGSE